MRDRGRESKRCIHDWKHGQVDFCKHTHLLCLRQNVVQAEVNCSGLFLGLPDREARWEGGTDRGREKDKERKRGTCIERDTHIKREIDKQTEGDRKRKRHRYKKKDKERDRETNTQTNRNIQTRK